MLVFYLHHHCLCKSQDQILIYHHSRCSHQNNVCLTKPIIRSDPIRSSSDSDHRRVHEHASAFRGNTLLLLHSDSNSINLSKFRSFLISIFFILINLWFQGTGLFSGFTRLCKGLAVVLVCGHIAVQFFPSAVNYLALIPARYPALTCKMNRMFHYA